MEYKLTSQGAMHWDGQESEQAFDELIASPIIEHMRCVSSASGSEVPSPLDAHSNEHHEGDLLHWVSEDEPESVREASGEEDLASDAAVETGDEKQEETKEKKRKQEQKKEAQLKHEQKVDEGEGYTIQMERRIENTDTVTLVLGAPEVQIQKKKIGKRK